jgi:hypothetical protein
MMDPKIIDARPEACPKGHPIWWFTGGGDFGRERPSYRWWGVCAGKRVADHIEVSGACRHTWIWHGVGSGLEIVPNFNSEKLMEVVRELAHECGKFRDTGCD